MTESEIVNQIFPTFLMGNTPKISKLIDKKKNKVVPITEVSIKANINSEFYYEVELNQKFVNNFDSPIEATYIFPLMPKCVVVEMSALLNGKKYVGTVMEKEKAKEVYDDSIASGKGAFLLEEKKEESNIMSLSLGNVGPKEEVTILIKYIKEMEFIEEGKREVIIPKIYAPRSSSIFEEKTYKVEVNINSKDNISFEVDNYKINNGVIMGVKDGIDRDIRIIVETKNDKKENLFLFEEKDSYGYGLYSQIVTKFGKMEAKETETEEKKPEETEEKVIFAIDSSFSIKKHAGLIKNSIKNIFLALKAKQKKDVNSKLKINASGDKHLKIDIISENVKNEEMGRICESVLDKMFNSIIITESTIGGVGRVVLDGRKNSFFSLINPKKENEISKIEIVGKKINSCEIVRFQLDLKILNQNGVLKGKNIHKFAAKEILDCNFEMMESKKNMKAAERQKRKEVEQERTLLERYYSIMKINKKKKPETKKPENLKEMISLPTRKYVVKKPKEIEDPIVSEYLKKIDIEKENENHLGVLENFEFLINYEKFKSIDFYMLSTYQTSLKSAIREYPGDGKNANCINDYIFEENKEEREIKRKIREICGGLHRFYREAYQTS